MANIKMWQSMPFKKYDLNFWLVSLPFKKATAVVQQ